MRSHDKGRVFGVVILAGLVCARLAWADAAEEAYDEGVRLVRAGRLREAVASFDKAIGLNPRSAEAYNSRGITYHALAQYEQAIKDYDEAVRINPASAEAYYNRANAYSDLGQHDSAVKDYDEAIRINPGYAEAYYNRGLASLPVARSEAAADAQTYLKLKGWRDPKSQYMVLVGYVADRRAQRDAEARTLLDDAATKCDSSAWPYPIIRYLRRELTAQDLLAAADDSDKKTEARAYLGLALSLSGDRDEALTHLRWVRDNGNKAFVEYAFALAELRRLEGP